MDDFAANLERYSGKIKLVAVTGASNVSGFLNPIHDIAELAHRHGAKIVADCAQLLPHRKIDMGPFGSPRHLDFIAFSAHKVYAPLGSGGLVGPREFFNQGDPDYVGGGVVEIVTLDEVTWTSAPEKDEAGSPNVIGAIGLAAALKFCHALRHGCDRGARSRADPLCIEQAVGDRGYYHIRLKGPGFCQPAGRCDPIPGGRAFPTAKWRRSWASRAGWGCATAVFAPIPTSCIC